MINPLIKLDYPDPDVIRVDDTYYMISTTMYFMPGGEILKSKDLINWEHAGFVYGNLDGTKNQRLEDGDIYGAGMWAASLRYHNGLFYVMFVCNDTKKTYLYRSESIEGPWRKSYVDGFYHDCSLLFDEDRVFVVHGNREIFLTELDAELNGPKGGGINKLIIKDTDEAILGYEGSHLYKINGRYYIFLIHSREDRWFRVESCFVSDTIDGEYVGRDILEDDIGYCDSGVAQGGIVDSPDGKWYGILFQDRGAVGRIPVLVNVSWENDEAMGGLFPSMTRLSENDFIKTEFGSDNGLWGSDDFTTDNGPSYGFKSMWQFNHEPKTEYVTIHKEDGCFELKTFCLADSIVKARNTLTQRLYFPTDHVEVTIDASNINDGDYAGLACLQDEYGFVAITKESGKYYLVMQEKTSDEEIIERVRTEIDSPIQTLSFDADFTDMKDEVVFNIGPVHKMYFKLTHFTGNRAALFFYSTKRHGGSVRFSDFVSR